MEKGIVTCENVPRWKCYMTPRLFL